jgi:hypothetical protein
MWGKAPEAPSIEAAPQVVKRRRGVDPQRRCPQGRAARLAYSAPVLFVRD